MTATCPAGHASTTEDYCDVCGARLGAGSLVEAAVESEPCPACGTARSADDRFCEGCGFDLVHGVAPAITPAVARAWRVTITADREYFERVAPAGADFPDGYEPRVLALDGDELTIGRASRSQAIEPDVDLHAGVEDPGVSHRHARLVRSTDGSYAVVDVGSTNGTTLNGAEAPIEPDTPVPLQSGDQVHVGAWTTLLIEQVEAVQEPA